MGKTFKSPSVLLAYIRQQTKKAVEDATVKTYEESREIMQLFYSGG